MVLQAPEDTAPPLSDVPGNPVEVRLSQCEGGIVWAELFGNDNPVEIEIGCGKGSFIIKGAAGNSTVNYFGIEKSGKYSRILSRRITNAGLKNVRILCGEAAHVIRSYCPPGSVAACHIFFPDPWPKKRHHKRRLITGNFLHDLHRILVPDGRINIATDFTDYFSWILQAAGSCSNLKQLSCRTVQPSDAEAELALTNYERKYLLQGRLIHKATYLAA